VGRKRSYVPLTVFLHSNRVGQLSREKSGAVHFQYDADWIARESAIPVSVSMPLRNDKYTGATVMAVFDNLLPDYEPIRRRVAERVGAQGTDAYSLLSEIGRDCIGALQFLPDDQEPETTNSLAGEPLTNDAIEALLNDLDVTPLGIRSESSFRISVAGAQEKTALLYHNQQWIQPDGTTPTSHIIKPQIGKLNNGIDLSNSVENEFYSLKLIEAMGLRTANVSMAMFNRKKALVIERFDRRWTDDGRLVRLPQEDCCQALAVAPTGKYQSEGGPGIEDIMDVLRGSDHPFDDRRDFFKATILFWLMGATDGHAKNFSLALSSRGRFRMTPLYDVLTIQPSVDSKRLAKKDFKLAMRVGQSKQYNVDKIRGRHFVHTGLKAGLSRQVISHLFDEIAAECEPALRKVAEMLPDDFPETIPASVTSAMRSRLNRLEME